MSREKVREVEVQPSGSGTKCSVSTDSVITTAPRRKSSQSPHFIDGEMEALKGRGLPEGTQSGSFGRMQSKYLTTGPSAAISQLPLLATPVSI